MASAPVEFFDQVACLDQTACFGQVVCGSCCFSRARMPGMWSFAVQIGFGEATGSGKLRGQKTA